jgi:hypothetical protein
MTNIKKTISEHLALWGKANRQISPRNESLKSEILAKAQIPIMEIARSRRSIPWFSFALAATALLVLFISPRVTKQNPAPAGLQNIENPKAENSIDRRRMTEEYFRQKLDMWGFDYSQPLGNRKPPLDKEASDYRTPLYANKPAEQRKSVLLSEVAKGKADLKEDTREFLKTSYNGYARCRHIGEFSQRIQVSIRGYGGRIDSTSSSERYGYINFAVPADKFDAFKNEIKYLFGERFYSEHIQTENLLPQKQSIEDQQQDTQNNLDRLRRERNGLRKSHEHKVASINSEIDAVAAEIASLQREVPDDWIGRMNIANRIRELQKKSIDLSNRLHNENDSFAGNLYSYTIQIRGNEGNLANLDKQDQNLIKTVATVRGVITLSWISIWEVIDSYIPLYWFAIFLMALAVIFYFIHRRKNRAIAI